MIGVRVGVRVKVRVRVRMRGEGGGSVKPQQLTQCTHTRVLPKVSLDLRAWSTAKDAVEVGGGSAMR